MALDSVYGGILQGAQRLIIAMALPGLAAAQVRRRKKAIRLQSDTVLPLCLICPSAERLTGANMKGGKDFLGYPLYAVYIQEGQFQYEHNLDWQLYVRELTRKALRVTTFQETAAVFDTIEYDPDPVFDLSSLEAGYDVSVQGFTYHAAEDRN